MNKTNEQTFMFLPMNIVVEGGWMEFSQFCAPCLYWHGPVLCTGDRWYFSDMFFHIFKVLPLHNSQQYGQLNIKLHIFFVKFRWMIFNSRWKEYKVYNFSSFKVIAIPSLHKFHLFKVQLQLVFVNVRKCKCLKFYSTLMKFSGIFFKDFPARPRLDWKTPFF